MGRTSDAATAAAPNVAVYEQPGRVSAVRSILLPPPVSSHSGVKSTSVSGSARCSGGRGEDEDAPEEAAAAAGGGAATEGAAAVVAPAAGGLRIFSSSSCLMRASSSWMVLRASCSVVGAVGPPSRDAAVG